MPLVQILPWVLVTGFSLPSGDLNLVGLIKSSVIVIIIIIAVVCSIR